MPEHLEKALPESVAELKLRLAEAEETLRAIREGEVDAVVVSGARGEQVYSLVGAESVYRLIVDTMHEAAFTVALDGTILYANGRFGEFVKQSVEQVVGHDLHQFVAAGDRAVVEAILTQGREQPVRQRLVFTASDGAAVPAYVSSNVLDVPDGPSICIVATDLTELENSTELIARLRQQQTALRESEERLREALEDAVAARAKTEETNRELLREIAERKQAEESLRESEIRERARAAEFEALMEAAPVGIFVSKDTECRSMSGNRAAYDLLRRPRGSNLSKSGPEGEKPVNFRAMKDGKEIPLPELPMQKSAASGKAVRDHEMDFVFEDGVTVNILGNAVPLLDESGRPRGAVGTFLDITERKRAEDALRESEGRFRGLSEAMPQIVWTAEASGARDYYNPRALEYAGASPSNLTGWNWTSIIHPEDREATLDAWRQAIATGQIHKIEHRLRRADGEFRWHLTRAVPLRNERGEVIHWIGTATDIHDQKMAEQELERRVAERTAELARSTALLETVTANAPVVLFATDANGTFTLHTGQAVAASGRKPGELIGKNCRIFLPERAQAVEHIHRALAGETFTAVLEGPHDSTFETRYNPLRDAHRNVTGMIAVAVDITERTRAEEALRDSQALTNAIVESTSDFIWTVDPERFGLLTFNAGLSEHFLRRGVRLQKGMVPEEAFADQELAARWRGMYQKALSDGSYTTEYNSPTAGFMLVTVNLLKRDGKVFAISVFGKDITERKQAETALQNVQARLTALLESTDDLIWSVDLEHRLLTFNKALERNIEQNYGIRAALGMGPEDLLTPARATWWPQAYERALSEGPYRVEYPLLDDRTLELSFNPIVEDNRKTGVAVFGKDITERVRAVKALQESEEAFRALAESVPQMVWMCTPDGLNVYFNQRWVDYSGLSLEESYGRGWNTPFHPDDKQPAWQAWNHAVETGDTYNIECRLRRADGIYRWFLTRGAPLRDSTGNVVKWFGTCTDIDDLKRAEAELHRLNRALRALSATDQAMVRAQDESELLQETCRILVDEGGYRMAWMGFAEPDEEKTVRLAAHAGINEGYLETVKITWADTERGRGPTGTAIRTRQPSVCQNMLEDPRIAPWREEARRRAYASSCALPLCVDGEPIGALTVYSALPEAFDTAEAELLAQLGADVAFGIESLRARAERQRAMETLEKHSAQLAEQARVLEIAPVAVLVRDLESRVTYWNRGAEEIYGWTSAEASGKVTHNLLQTKFPEPFSEMEAKIFSGVTWQGELTHHKRTGEEVVVVSRQVLRRDKQGKPTGYLEINLDISARKQAEEALKAERQRFFSVLETLPPMICLLTPDYHVAFANRAFRERFGESQGRRCYDYCFGNSAPCEFCQTYDVLKTGQPRHWEISAPEGSVIDVYDLPFTDADGTPMILEMDIDITEAKRAKEGLEKANAYNRSLLESSLDPLVTISPNGKITDVNSAAEKVTGRLREELIGDDFSDYFTDPEKARLGYQQVFKEGLVQDYELEVRRRDGSTTPVLYNASVYRDQGGEVVGVFAAARDITTRKRAEEEVRRLNEELEQRVRLRTAQLEASNKELESFSYSVSHDLRAPLRAMDGFSRILLEEYRSQLPSKAQRYLDFVRGGAAHMGDLIDGLLALSRLGRQELKRRPVEVAEIVKQSMDDLRAEVEGSGAEFVVGRLPSCDADPLLLRQVFVNLLSNALKFSRKQEKVRIEFGALRAHEAAQAPVEVLRLVDPHTWIYYVRDNGVGFDMRYADKLFGVFQRLHRQEDFKGTGIGLATVQQIIHRHGGQVWAEAEVGKGATFYFTVGPSQDLASG